jgi:hypothetical protein
MEIDRFPTKLSLTNGQSLSSTYLKILNHIILSNHHTEPHTTFEPPKSDGENHQHRTKKIAVPTDGDG